MDTRNSIVRKIGLLIEALERVKTKKVEIPLVGILLEVADLNSEREGS